MKIGIFGGTFDPFTIAHMAIIDRVFELKLVDKLFIVPTIVSYYRQRKQRWLSDTQRISVISKFIANSKNFNNIYIDYDEISFAKEHSDDEISQRRYFHTLIDFVKKFSVHDDELYTIIGTDSLCNFNTWWNYEKILEYSRLIAVAGRNDIILPDNKFNAILIDIDDKYKNISATAIRNEFLDKGINEYLKGVV